jgi:hypothetical protein
MDVDRLNKTTVVISVRLTGGLHHALTFIAERDHRSLNSQIIHFLSEAINRDAAKNKREQDDKAAAAGVDPAG